VRKLDVALLTAVAAAIAVAAAVLPNLDDDKPEVLPPAGEVVEIHADELDPAPAERDPGNGVVLNTGQPLACMFRVDCLMEQVEEAAGAADPRTPSRRSTRDG
jgi:hypothetical protein